MGILRAEAGRGAPESLTIPSASMEARRAAKLCRNGRCAMALVRPQRTFLDVYFELLPEAKPGTVTDRAGGIERIIV